MFKHLIYCNLQLYNNEREKNSKTTDKRPEIGILKWLGKNKWIDGMKGGSHQISSA